MQGTETGECKMKRNVCLQSTLRQPVRTLFLLLLIGLLAFVFISRAVEYLVVDREIDRLAGYYRPIGFLEPFDGFAFNGVELISKSQYVAFEDRRRGCSGVLQGLFNADVSGYKSSDTRHLVSSVLVYGVLDSKSQVSGWYQFTLKVDHVAAGYPEFAQEGRSIRLRCSPEEADGLDAIFNSLEVGGRYFVKAHFEPSVGITWQSASANLTLKPLNDSALWFLPVEPGKTADFTDPALQELWEELQVMNENQRAMFVVSTRDMSAMPSVQESSRDLYLAEGRWLDRLDDLNGNRVCVVHRDFAALRGLSLGDTLTLKLRELKTPFEGYIVNWERGKDWGAWQEYETHKETFEIVGLYGTLSRGSSQDTSRMYIPDSVLPVGWGDALWWGSPYFSSFILYSYHDIDAFVSQNREDLAKLGLRVSIMDNGWENFQASVGPVKQSVALNAGIFLLVLLLAMTLIAFLYLRQRRREFAILRALGVPKPVAIWQLLQSMTVVGAVGVLVGGLPSWSYALGKAGDTLASLQGIRGDGLSNALSLSWLAGLCAGVITLLLFSTAVGALVTTRRPVLEHLQGTVERTAGKRKVDAVGDISEVNNYGLKPASTINTRSIGETPTPTKSIGLAQVTRYVLRHIRRAPLKSVLTVTVALCFTLSLGWISWSIERNEAELDRLYITTQVEAEIIKSNSSFTGYSGVIWPRTVDAIISSGFVQSVYLEGSSTVPHVFAVGEGGVRDDARVASDVTLLAFDQQDLFFSIKGGKDLSVKYADGWDMSLFAKDWTEIEEHPVMLPISIMAQLRLQLGDKVLIPNKAIGGTDSFVIAGYYTGTVDGSKDTEPLLIPTSALKLLEGDRFLYSAAEFVLDPARNRELQEFRTRMETFFARGDVGIVKLDFLFWDGELTQVVEPLEKNLSLMAVLYPVTVAVSILIAAGLAALLMLQAAKDAAIMRVLGTAKGRARSMLCGEQLALSLLGLLLGLTLLIILRQDASAVINGPALACAALYLAGAICGAVPSAISVTNRMPLELLQVKE